MCVLQVVIIDFFNGLEVDHAFQLGFVLVYTNITSRQHKLYINDGIERHPQRKRANEDEFPTRVVGERPSIAVEDEPALFPGLDLAAHLDQVASARLFRDRQVEARVGVVARRLNVSPQVKIVLSHREVPCERSGLEQKGWKRARGPLLNGKRW